MYSTYRAFPSWEMNKLGDCAALQFVQGFEVDPTVGAGVLWLADIGREIGKASRCGPKLVLIDISTERVIQVRKGIPQPPLLLMLT